jgi:SPP1 gp7 family putative phage head morphogenesis protein
MPLIRKAANPKPPPEDPIIQAADRMLPKARRAFLDAIQAIKDGVALREIANAIERGDAGQVIAILDVQGKLEAAANGAGLATGVRSLREVIQQTYAAGAAAAIRELPERISLELAFDLLNQRAVNFLRTYSFSLIREISQDTALAIRNVVLGAFQQGGHPYAQAREIRDLIGLTESQARAVDTFRRALESREADQIRQALERGLRDKRFDPTLRSALEGGSMSQEQIDRMVSRYYERALAYRAETIARTETIRASMAGEHEAWRQAAEQGLLDTARTRRIWITAHDERVCPVCQPLNGVQVRLGEPFTGGIDAPPAHPRCRCSVGIKTIRKARVAA